MSISVRELLEAGAHFGHQTHRWNPKMRPFIYGARNGIHIIDLQKTAKLWAQAKEAISRAVTKGEKVLFVGTKPQAQEVIAEEATRANQPYVDRRWLGGMLTNFKTIKSRIDRLEEIDTMKTSGKITSIPKKEALLLEKEREKLEKSLCGIKKMDRLPGVVVIVDPKKEHIAIREARRLQIPLIAICDTNCDPEGIDFVVPANDDAVKSIRLFLSAAAEACLEGVKAFELRIQEETRKSMEREKQKAKAVEVDSDVESQSAASDDTFETKAKVVNAERLAASPDR